MNFGTEQRSYVVPNMTGSERVNDGDHVTLTCGLRHLRQQVGVKAPVAHYDDCKIVNVKRA